MFGGDATRPGKPQALPGRKGWRACARRSWRAILPRRKRCRSISCGHSNKDIADRLAISARTVEDHRAAIMAKTGAAGLAILMVLAKGG